MSVVDGFPRRLLALLREHLPLLAVLGVATFMRVWFVYAYPYAFFFPDSRSYVLGAADGVPDVARPWGTLPACRRAARIRPSQRSEYR